MGKNLAAKFLEYARQNGADNLIIAGEPEAMTLDYYRPGETAQRLNLPRRLEAEFLAGLRRLLSIRPAELPNQTYRKLSFPTGELNIEVTIRPTEKQETIAIKFLNRSPKLWRLGQLGLKYADRKRVEAALRRSGLILIAGPAGSGKSATLYALLLALNSSAANLYLLSERPLFDIPGVNTLKPTAANWSSLLRHDSDMILADDLKDDSDLAGAARAAATGRLVIATITADGLIAAQKQWETLDLPKHLKNSSLRMIISQRLAKLERPPHKRGPADRQVIGRFEVWTPTGNAK